MSFLDPSMFPMSPPAPAPRRPRMRDLKWGDILSNLHIPGGGGGGLGGALSRIGTGLMNAPGYAFQQKLEEYGLEQQRREREEEKARERERQERLDAEARRRSEAEIAARELSAEATRARIKAEQEEAERRRSEQARQEELRAARAAAAESGDLAAVGRQAFVETGDPRSLALGQRPEYRRPLPDQPRFVEWRNPDGRHGQMILPEGASVEGITDIREISTPSGRFTVILDQDGNKLGLKESDSPQPRPWQKLLSKADLDAVEDQAEEFALRDMEKLAEAGEIPGMTPEALRDLVGSGAHVQNEHFKSLFGGHLDNAIGNLRFRAEARLEALERQGGGKLERPPDLIDPGPGSADSSGLSGGPAPTKLPAIDVDAEIRAMVGSRGPDPQARRQIALLKQRVRDFARERGISEEEAFRALFAAPAPV